MSNNTTAVIYPTYTDDSTRVPVILLYSVLAVICMFANSLVCYVIATRKTTDGSLKYYVFSLAITDILVGAACIPVFLAKEYIWHAKWDLLESFSTGFDILLGTCSILHLCLMALDRVLSVTRPILYHTRLRHKKSALKLLSIPWIIAVILANIPFIGRSKEFEYYTAYSIIALIPIPCVFIVICYVKLYDAVRRRNAVLRQSSETDLTVHQSHMMKMILCMILAFVTCWIPIVIFYSIYTKHSSSISQQTQHLLHYSAKFLSYFNSVCNPVIYALLNPVFKNGLKDVLKSCFHLSR